MNDIVTALGLEGYKFLFGALILPPVPLLLLVLVGARLMFRQRMLAWTLIMLGVVGLYLTATPALGKYIGMTVHRSPPALTERDIEALARDAAKGPPTAIVVLGGGGLPLQSEYGMSNLKPLSIERLRYGIWLARRTGLPVAFSGGADRGGRLGTTEADIAARIADREFRFPLRWLEDRSSDTTENGLLTVPMLQQAGIQRIVLVTHDFHEKRAVRAFRRGAERSGQPLEILPAPVGVTPPYEWQVADWLPGGTGIQSSWLWVREWVGYLLGA
ncbi:MAG: YdcF family protein [Rubrivivax sp.]|nr:YdcF family protein [Rubrivivax sp.]